MTRTERPRLAAWPQAGASSKAKVPKLCACGHPKRDHLSQELEGCNRCVRCKGWRPRGLAVDAVRARR